MSVTTRIVSSPRIHHVSAALLTTFLLSTAPASAQGNTVRQGVLTCRISASVGLLVGSRQRLRCHFRSESGRTQKYIGTIGRLGFDIGFTAGGVMAWAVLASTPTIPSGALAGEFVGASGDISAWSWRWRQPAGRRHAQIGFAAAVVGGRTGRRQSRARRRSHETQANQLNTEARQRKDLFK